MYSIASISREKKDVGKLWASRNSQIKANEFAIPQIIIIKATRLGNVFLKDPDVKIILFLPLVVTIYHNKHFSTYYKLNFQRFVH